ncbi:MAG: alpha/beta fold hydrolase [Myxococcales bacterium]|nr:alpha/beta fold hydrolase [Myxococcales bacterium]
MPALAVGCRALAVFDAIQEAPVPTWVLYPARAPTQMTRFGPYQLPLATDMPVVGEGLRFVVVSHGNGGTGWAHRDTAMALARAGFVVALLEHPGNGRSDNRLAGTAANLANRPRHLRTVLDAVQADAEIGPRLASGDVALIGHSIGGYTALALAGGRPLAFARETSDGIARPVPVESDPRVSALVLLAPATPWFMAGGALAAVEQPIFMRTGEQDIVTPEWHADIVRTGVPDPQRVDHRVVPGAGHFSFQSPFPPEMLRSDFPPAHDPPGFDRAAYQSVLNAEIIHFLRAV